jgi:AraC family transcriptional activator of pobA
MPVYPSTSNEWSTSMTARPASPDEPHRHDFYTILLVKEAAGKHFIDFQEFDLANNQIYFISPGQVHQIVEDQKSYGWVMTISRQFLVENGIDASFIADLHLFQDYGYSPPLEADEGLMKALGSLTDQIFDFTHSDKKFKYEAVGALLKLFLIQCNNACSLSIEENTQQVHASLTLLRNFKSLLVWDVRGGSFELGVSGEGEKGFFPTSVRRAKAASQ